MDPEQSPASPTGHASDSARESLSPVPSSSGDKSKKRQATEDPESTQTQKVTKRRAARACVSCRARKVRCDVVEGAPCGNCRWDNVECVVQESRRRKKNHMLAASAGPKPPAEAQELRCKDTAANDASNITTGHETNLQSLMSASDLHSPSSDILSGNLDTASGSFMPNSNGQSHVPHMLYQRSQFRRPSMLGNQNAQVPQGVGMSQAWPNLMNQAGLINDARTAQLFGSIDDQHANAQLPGFVRPLPRKIDDEDVKYLYVKGALAIPTIGLQNALLQSYVEYVHPYMPLIDLHEFLSIVHRRDGLNGQTSLLLFQAVMFSATAFIDMKHLREAGYPTRKAARRAFFQKTRLLYDFDYESDRLVLVQALLLMTYWYDTPDDQKDTWHWMGVAISLAHTIGLHRNPESTSMSPLKQKLWKRIWWSCFMRDRLIALGMRRPTRIKDEDFDVPMLTEDDFDIQALPDNINVVPAECTVVRDMAMQRELAIMCVTKAKLCVCISHMLKAQYSVLIRDNMKPENTTNSTMMLFPNKKLDNVESVNAVDLELMSWAKSLPECCQYRALTPRDVQGGASTVAVQRTLLHMVYYTTISALHRPQFLPSSPHHAPTTSRQVQEMSRLRVRNAATHITRMATELHNLRLERFLPTTGVTVILPAMIIHLLEMKNPAEQARERATRGFRQCMRVMEKLREIYAAADYATGFLDAALKKAAIDINAHVGQSTLAMMKHVPVEFSAHTPPPENIPYMTASESFFNEKPSKGGHQGVIAPNMINTMPSDASNSTPPNIDFDPVGGGAITPSASAESEEVQLETDGMDLDFMQGHDEFDWNAVAGTDFDVDQWLQFPAEGAPTMSGLKENSVANAYGSNIGSGSLPTAQGLEFA